MFENQPDLVRELNRSGKLEEHLNDKLMAAYRLDKQMRAGEVRERPDRGGGDGDVGTERRASDVGQPAEAAPTEGEKSDLAETGSQGGRRAKAARGPEPATQPADLTTSYPKAKMRERARIWADRHRRSRCSRNLIPEDQEGFNHRPSL